MSRADDIRARADAATPGPWRYEAEHEPAAVFFIVNEGGELRIVADNIAYPNADFIANAREDVPYLLAERDRLTELLAEGVLIVSGTGEHVYLGNCPDSVEGPDLRDPDCPACRWLDRALAAGPPKEDKP